VRPNLSEIEERESPGSTVVQNGVLNFLAGTLIIRHGKMRSGLLIWSLSASKTDRETP
jgi:hypothetical protein